MLNLHVITFANFLEPFLHEDELTLALEFGRELSLILVRICFHAVLYVYLYPCIHMTHRRYDNLSYGCKLFVLVQ